KSFKSKLRSQIKKSGEYGLEVEFGGAENLGDFYTVFARNMRDLGTPVFSRKLFANILKQFGNDAEICVVRKDRRAVAGGLLVHLGSVTEVPSASCLREFNRTNANMLMYQHLLQRAIERGSQTFDFGRSSAGSGTYKFKAQWGAQPQPAVWQYYVRKGSPEDMRPDAEGKQRLVKIWQRLPVSLTRLIGPPIVRGIP
ncbi:MAG: GNAT family N-acetyltransferase, partial [Pirellulales bacterium]|nr:GNAT family N-acetyltransferase [Pirellulales bacterium]